MELPALYPPPWRGIITNVVFKDLRLEDKNKDKNLRLKDKDEDLRSKDKNKDLRS